MRRADRLFQIIELLRRRRRATTAAQIAGRLGVSTRTVYRDVHDLMGSGVPISGEAGVGYLLERSYDLPPLMFDEDELEALVLGARMVSSRTDPELARAADRLLAKVEAVVPERLRPRLEGTTLFAFDFRTDRDTRDRLGALRIAARDRRKVLFRYTDRAEERTSRTVQPLGLFYWAAAWTLASWCELRDDFRNFRVDRIEDLAVLDEPFEPVDGRTLEDLFKRYEEGSA